MYSAVDGPCETVDHFELPTASVLVLIQHY